jgi:hypothetical protein
LKTLAEVCVPDPLGQTAQTLRLWEKIARVAKMPRCLSEEVAENQHAAPARATQSLQAELKCNERPGAVFRGRFARPHNRYNRLTISP